MRCFERIDGESAAAYRAVAVFRDLGPSRTLRQVAAVLYGEGYREGTRRVPGRIKGWSADHDWIARADAYDAHLQMVGLRAVEEHERARATDLAKRREDLRLKNFENEEKAAELQAKVLAEIERMGFVRRRAVRVEDGRAVEYVIEPSVGSLDLAAQRLHKIAKASEPTKIAPTDPTGEYEFGKSPEEIDEEFDEMLRSHGVEPDVEDGP